MWSLNPAFAITRERWVISGWVVVRVEMAVSAEVGEDAS